MRINSGYGLSRVNSGYGLSRVCGLFERMDSCADTVCLACAAYSNEWTAVRIRSVSRVRPIRTNGQLCGYGLSGVCGLFERMDSCADQQRIRSVSRVRPIRTNGQLCGYGLSRVCGLFERMDSCADQQRIRSVSRVRPIRTNGQPCGSESQRHRQRQRHG